MGVFLSIVYRVLEDVVRSTIGTLFYTAGVTVQASTISTTMDSRTCTMSASDMEVR